MKLFKKIGELNTKEEVIKFLSKTMCDKTDKCSNCQLNSTNRPYRDFWAEDDFCCLEMFSDILDLDIEER